MFQRSPKPDPNGQKTIVNNDQSLSNSAACCDRHRESAHNLIPQWCCLCYGRKDHIGLLVSVLQRNGYTCLAVTTLMPRGGC